MGRPPRECRVGRVDHRAEERSVRRFFLPGNTQFLGIRADRFARLVRLLHGVWCGRRTQQIIDRRPPTGATAVRVVGTSASWPPRLAAYRAFLPDRVTDGLAHDRRATRPGAVATRLGSDARGSFLHRRPIAVVLRGETSVAAQPNLHLSSLERPWEVPGFVARLARHCSGGHAWVEISTKSLGARRVVWRRLFCGSSPACPGILQHLLFSLFLRCGSL